MNNKEVLNYCPNYYNIVNFNFHEDDSLSEKLVNIYKKFIFSIDINNKEDSDRVYELDKVFYSYIEDYSFRSELQKEIVNVKVEKNEHILTSLVDSIIKIFSNYEEFTTKKLYISKWI